MKLLPLVAVLLVFQGTDNQPNEPYRIADNIYYVGASDIASYLVTTPSGHVIIDAGYESTVPIIQANVEKLGYKLGDVKYLVNTQAHFDHAAGFASLKALSGAQLWISEQDAATIEAGGRNDPVLKGAENHFPPAKVDRRLHDGDSVRVGNVTLTARLTPGHTRGCTTWTLDARDRDRTYKVVVLGGLQILPGTRLTGPAASWPTIETDYQRTFEVLEHMPVDIFLGAHRAYYDGAKKADRLRANPGGPNPFVDPDGFRALVASAKKRFNELVAQEKQ